MSTLASLQRRFQRHVLRPGRAMSGEVTQTPRAGAARRLSVYADGYRARLTEALSSDYPAVRAVLGPVRFEAAMRGFVESCPSRHRNLRWYGGDLARFLEHAPRWRRRPLLAELARFEWALGLAFDAADAPLASAADAARVPPADWPGLRLRLQPSVQLLVLRSNAPMVWRAAVENRTVPAAARRRHATWLVWRQGHESFYRELSPAEARALGAAKRGCDFAAIAESLQRLAGARRAAQAAAQYLHNWLAEGLVAGIE
ncbi:MAG: HvfC/BufC N-terminal domain-containing protein [Betaproteobacteria bacterium]